MGSRLIFFWGAPSLLLVFYSRELRKTRNEALGWGVMGPRETQLFFFFFFKHKGKWIPRGNWECLHLQQYRARDKPKMRLAGESGWDHAQPEKRGIGLQSFLLKETGNCWTVISSSGSEPFFRLKKITLAAMWKQRGACRDGERQLRKILPSSR